MGFYEVMFIIRPDLEAEQQEEVLNGLKTTIARQEGTLKSMLDWRKRRLAYEIEKHKEGSYFLAYFSGQSSLIPEIEHFFRVTDEVIRYMIIRLDEKDYEAVSEEVVEEPTVAAADEMEVSETDEGSQVVASEQDQPQPLETGETASETLPAEDKEAAKE